MMNTGGGDFTSEILIKPESEVSVIHATSKSPANRYTRERRINRPNSPIWSRPIEEAEPKKSSTMDAEGSNRVILVRRKDSSKKNSLVRSHDAEEMNAMLLDVNSYRRHQSLPSYSDDNTDAVDIPKVLQVCVSSGSLANSLPDHDESSKRPGRDLCSEKYLQVRRSEHPYRLRTTTADRVSVQHDSSDNVTDEEEVEKYPLTPCYESAPESDPRQVMLTELLGSEKSHLEQLESINAVLCKVNKHQKIQTKWSKQAQDIIENLIGLQTDYVKRLGERLKGPFDSKTTIADVFQSMPIRQEKLLEYQGISQHLISYCELLQARCLINFADCNSSSTSKANTIDSRQTLDPSTMLLMTLTPSTNPDAKELKQLFSTLTNSAHSSPAVCLFGEHMLEKHTRELKVHSMIVELERSQSDERKLRYLLLFTDVLVCAKIRMLRKDRHRTYFGEGANKQRTTDRVSMLLRSNVPQNAHDMPLSEEPQTTRLEAKWIIPLDQLVIGANSQVLEGE
ncbi:unnamed protein product [Echinostoma caproni]|uniref:DH domain-containing protein n=1 Tax=Echinostoma caproni TaxID=27848 RepID=A0A183AEZ9_9TREM|nr:unnamed protein product [Echinostoma caproni]